MRNFFWVLILLILVSFDSSAQWTKDPALNTIIADTTGSQVLPKAIKCIDGYSYITWFDTRGGSYAMYLQKMSATGVREWGNNGVLISDKPQNSYISDYSLECDKTNNAILAFTDVRMGIQSVFAYKISPMGKFLWGNEGILVSGGKESAVNPSIAVTREGNYVIAWISQGNIEKIELQKFSVDGKSMWGKTIVQYSSKSGEGYTNPKVVPSDKGSVILMHTVTSGQFPAQKVKIAAQKFSSKGQILWGNGGKWIQDIGKVMVYTPPFFDSDGKDGAIIAWHDDRNSTNIQSAYVQRINSKGAIAFQRNGAGVATQDHLNKFNPVAGVLSATNEVVVTWRMTPSGQSESGLYAQKFDAQGERMWGAEGLELIPIGSKIINGIEMVSLAKKIVVGYVESNDMGVNGTLNAVEISADGTTGKVKSSIPVSTFDSQKGKLFLLAGLSGSVIFIWEDSRKDENGIYGQKLDTKKAISF